MREDLKTSEQKEEGATMLEYALLAALIAVVCIGAVTFLGARARVSFSNSAVALSTAN
jgi:pilus assembly protein Flp/PilA